MITISLCMIVKNEESFIGRCLDTVNDIVDEINIIDTGSTDNTKDIALKYTNRVFDFEWVDNFSLARNFSFNKATKDYILWLDADDIFLEIDRTKLKNLKYTLDNSVDSVTFMYNYSSDEEGKPLLIFPRERLVKRERNFKWVGYVHEYINTYGNQVNSDITVTHKRIHNSSYRNLNIYKKNLEYGNKLTNRDMYYYGKELYYHRFWDESIKILELFLDTDSWFEDKIDASCAIADCYGYKGDTLKERSTLFKALEYTVPRGEIMYRIGYSFQKDGKIDEAIFWYKTILNTEIPKTISGFIYPEYWTWKPNLQLCVCYYELGDVDKSYYYHKKSYESNPIHESIIANQDFFNSIECI